MLISTHLSSSEQTHNTQLRSKMTSMVAFPMAVTERTQNRAISIFSYLAGKTAPRRPADFTGVFYAPEYPFDGLGSVSFLQISWIRPRVAGTPFADPEPTQIYFLVNAPCARGPWGQRCR